MPKGMLDSWIPTAAAVLLGIVLGLVWGKSEWRGAGVASENGLETSRSSAGTGDAGANESGGKPRKRPRPAGNGEIGLSPKQWRMLQENPSLLNINLGQCITWKGIREVPVEDAKGFAPMGVMMKETDDGPDLSAIAGFFGLDEIQTTSLGAALKRFGEQIRSVESRTEQVEYRGDGTMRIIFPGGEQEKKLAFDDLAREMRAALGAQDAERLWALSALAIEAEKIASGIEAGVSISGEWVTAGLPNEHETIFSRLDGIQRGAQVSSLEWIPGIGGDGLMRTRHLQHRIDWKKLYLEAEIRAGK
jgi:hypothetical protein